MGEDESARKNTHLLVQDEAPRIRNDLRSEQREALKRIKEGLDTNVQNNS